MRRLILLSFVVSSVAVAQAWDEDDSARRKRNSGSGTAPTGFLVPTGVDDTEWDEEEAAPVAAEDEGDTRTKRRSGEAAARDRAPEVRAPEEPAAWTDPEKKKGIVVIEENTAAPSVIRAGELDPDRVGRSLGGAPTKGLSLGASRADEGVSTFTATADDAPPKDRGRPTQPARERAGSPPKTKGSSASVPTSILVPVVDDDFEETPSARSDPFDAPAARPRDDTPTARSLLDDLPTGDLSSRPTGRAQPAAWDGEPVKVEEVKVDYEKQETFIRVDGKKAAPKQVKATPPKPEVVVAPPPRKAAPALDLDDEPARNVAAEPQPERLLSPEPTPAPRPVKAAPKAALSYDPFAKLEGDLADAEGRPRPKVEPPPESVLPDPPDEPTYRRPPELARESFADPEMAAKPLDEPKETASKRDPDFMGLSLVAGLGLLVANDPAAGYALHFGGGANARWHPDFLGQLSLDVSFWRASQADGTPVVTVDTAWTHLALRVLYVQEYGDGPFIGGGGGLLVTHVSSSYVVNDLVSETKAGGLARPGLDLTAMFGWRFRPVEVRLDLRALLRGGLRLDYLPTLSFGVSL